MVQKYLQCRSNTGWNIIVEEKKMKIIAKPNQKLIEQKTKFESDLKK